MSNNTMQVNQQRMALMREKLNQALNPTELDIIDDSHLHVGHVGARGGAGHFTVIIASDNFSDKTKVQCHQLIYQCLNDMMPQDIHALSIKIK